MAMVASSVLAHNARLFSLRPLFFTSRRFFLIFGNGAEDRSMSYKERRILGYSQEQMFEIAVDVGRYSQFVPWCNESVILRKLSSGALSVRLGVGFPPLSESYISTVTFERPGFVKSVAECGTTFKHLVSYWHFWPGLVGSANTCTLEFSVEFEFKSVVYAKIAGLFFDQVVVTMVDAFIERARRLHGAATIPLQKPEVLIYKK